MDKHLKKKATQANYSYLGCRARTRTVSLAFAAATDMRHE